MSWAAAKATVQATIDVAAQAGGEVWAAVGTYAEHVTVPAYVFLYGGFSGVETARDQRNTASFLTVLDGGGIPPVVMSSNAGYLVSGVDGFTVQNGGLYCGGAIPLQGGNHVKALGGGIRSRVASPVLANNIIRRNSVGNPTNVLFAKGGGIALYQSHAIIQGNTSVPTPPVVPPPKILIANNIVAYNSSGLYATLTSPNYFARFAVFVAGSLPPGGFR